MYFSLDGVFVFIDNCM